MGGLGSSKIHQMHPTDYLSVMSVCNCLQRLSACFSAKVVCNVYQQCLSAMFVCNAPPPPLSSNTLWLCSLRAWPLKVAHTRLQAAHDW